LHENQNNRDKVKNNVSMRENCHKSCQKMNVQISFLFFVYILRLEEILGYNSMITF